MASAVACQNRGGAEEKANGNQTVRGIHEQEQHIHPEWPSSQPLLAENCFILQSTNISASSFVWDQSSYSARTLPSPDSSESIFPSPTSAEALLYPSSPSALPKSKFDVEFKTDPALSFSVYEDWMRWEDPSENALSPTSDFFVEPKVEPKSPHSRGLGLQGSVGSLGASFHPSAIPNAVDDIAAVFGEDPGTEEPLFQMPGARMSPLITEVPLHQELVSSALSWAPNAHKISKSSGAVLTAQQESKLRDIAMPPQQYPTSPSSASSPEPPSNRRKRKSSTEDDGEDDSPPPAGGRHPPGKKTAHNMIEKRYRTNLNDKIAALRDSVPSLRVVTRKNSRGGELPEDLQGLTPAHKLNKATVLSKASEYIAHLEKRNKSLANENAVLKSRIDAFEILVMARQSPKAARSTVRHGSRTFALDGMVG